jgi:NADH:ubiquinone oxidoreductase subunit 6 (subunit J)
MVRAPGTHQAPAQTARWALWSLGLGLVTLAGAVALLIPDTTAAFVDVGGVLLFGGGVGAMITGLVVLRGGESASPRTRKTAFAGTALGSLLLAALVFFVASVFVSFRSASSDLQAVTQQTAQVEQQCMTKQVQAGSSPADAAGSCSACPISTGAQAGNTVVFCRLTVGSTSRNWAVPAAVGGGWAVVVLAGWWLLLGRRSRAQTFPPPSGTSCA